MRRFAVRRRGSFMMLVIRLSWGASECFFFIYFLGNTCYEIFRNFSPFTCFLGCTVCWQTIVIFKEISHIESCKLDFSEVIEWCCSSAIKNLFVNQHKFIVRYN